jgi:hypothetical protein
VPSPDCAPNCVGRLCLSRARGQRLGETPPTLYRLAAGVHRATVRL